MELTIKMEWSSRASSGVVRDESCCNNDSHLFTRNRAKKGSTMMFELFHASKLYNNAAFVCSSITNRSVRTVTMPGVSSFTPSWLSRPSPGFNLFNHDPSDAVKKQTGGAEASTTGPCRTTACRGTEVFVAVGNEIRWSDLILLRDEWEDCRQSNSGTKDDEIAYRVGVYCLVPT